MLTNRFTRKELRILFFDLKQMCFYIVFSEFHYAHIYDTSGQGSTFDEDFFAIRKPRDSDASISDFVDGQPFENFLHQKKKE